MWFITTLPRFLYQQLTNRKLLYCGNSGRVIRENYVIVISVLYKHLSSCTKFKSLESSGLISKHSRSSPKKDHECTCRRENFHSTTMIRGQESNLPCKCYRAVLNICQYTWKLYETWWGSWSLSDICSQSEQEVVTWDTSCPYSVLYTSKVTYYLLLLNILPTNEESKIDFCHCFPWFHGPLIIRCVTSNLPCTTIMVTWLWGTFIGSHLEAYNILALLELLLCEFPHISLSLFWAQTRDCSALHSSLRR